MAVLELTILQLLDGFLNPFYVAFRLAALFIHAPTENKLTEGFKTHVTDSFFSLLASTCKELYDKKL